MNTSLSFPVSGLMPTIRRRRRPMTKTPAQWKQEERARLREFRERVAPAARPPCFVEPVKNEIDDDDGMPNVAPVKQEPVVDPQPESANDQPKRKRGRPRKNANAQIDQEIRSPDANEVPSGEV